MASKLKTPKQIGARIGKLKKEISLLERAKTAETRARSAVKKASRSSKRSKSKKRRRPARKKSPARQKKKR